MHDTRRLEVGVLFWSQRLVNKGFKNPTVADTKHYWRIVWDISTFGQITERS